MRDRERDLAVRLPEDFVFGTSTAAYQIEGAVTEDGRGPSVWDTYTATPGRVVDGSSGAVACDHYHRYREDIALMARLGAPGYRFSIAWSRIQPTGSGPANQKGLDFYDRLVDGLLEAGIRPMATLFHWDLPQALEDDGGWLNRVSIERFADYAAIMGKRLGDRVADWVPVNEPNVVTLMGHAVAMHAPGKALMFDALPVGHHLLVAHGRAAIELRAAGATSVGCANNHAPIWPASDDPADVGAAKLFDSIWNGHYLEGMLLGRYSADLEMLLEDHVRDGDFATMRQPLDFYGINYYNPMRIGAGDDDAELPFEFREVLGHPVTDFGWPVVPEALREWLIMFRARLRAAIPPIVITESGCAYNNGPDADGVVDDQARIDYHAAHLAAVAEAIERGVDVRGYYAWSLMDNFEWSEGYTQRFGFVHVDYETQVRTPKRSFDWYADLVARHRTVGQMP
ncbi:beta-glucosidase [Nocardioides sp. Root190]|uniref:GH1 family beta-glucosidase n=1 Tax=Nocardioides sp. Root190 TaxID=1736488 RepID=UPI0006FB27E3|nr:GH1 family beta-glucosidase [Nocardioides sp. Root190]KRB78364.1 beta-glucosidase [Nocardioides sp. Root190]